MAIKPLAIKITATVIGTGGAFAIGHQTYKALQSSKSNKVSNRNKLISEKYKLLGTEEGNDVTWNAILNSYKEVIKKKVDLAFKNFDGNDKEGKKALEILKNECKESLNSENEELLNKVKKWCTTPTKVSDGLVGRRIFNTNDSKDSEDQQEWNEKIKRYTATGNTNKIDGLDLTGGPISSPAQEHRNHIRAKCKELNDKKSYEGDYEDALNKAKEWCSVEGAN